jgi:hypothetical protein
MAKIKAVLIGYFTNNILDKVKLFITLEAVVLE